MFTNFTSISKISDSNRSDADETDTCVLFWSNDNWFKNDERTQRSSPSSRWHTFSLSDFDGIAE
jgi:hypothetical protein